MEYSYKYIERVWFYRQGRPTCLRIILILYMNQICIYNHITSWLSIDREKQNNIHSFLSIVSPSPCFLQTNNNVNIDQTHLGIKECRKEDIPVSDTFLLILNRYPVILSEYIWNGFVWMISFQAPNWLGVMWYTWEAK